MNVLCEMDSLKDSNTELELDIRRLKGELKRREDKERKTDEIKKELDFYKRENDLLRKDLENANEENAQIRVILKKQETSFLDFKRKAKDEDLRNAENREKVQQLEMEIEEILQENSKLKSHLKDLSERAENERRYRSELEKIKLNLLSERNNEVEKLNDMFESIFKGEEKSKHRTPVSRQYKNSHAVSHFL